jgi:decaprenyl-phosphate phosphoribosyltransferase
MAMKNYISIARPDHWVKNTFILPGLIIALLISHISIFLITGKLLIGIMSICFSSSANYVINEWLDAEFDKYHPVKKNRPAVIGNLNCVIVYIEYIILSILGLSLAFLISKPYFIMTLSLLIMGIFYNVEPFRTKDRIYLDVLSESINNAIRLLLGWFIVDSSYWPPSSLVFGYWMGGAFLMAVKRYSEFRFIRDPQLAGLYRRSFKFYNDKTLLISSVFYAMCSFFFIGIFLVKYRIELLISIPFIAGLFCWYLNIGMKENSSAQHPEYLYKERFLIFYSIFLLILISTLFVWNIPVLHIFTTDKLIPVKF